MSPITYTPIGIVHSPFSEAKGVPIQPGASKGTPGTVEVYPEFAEGLTDLEGFSHITVVAHLHLCEGYELMIVPFLDTVKRGVFATRAPRRPNSIGISILRLEGIEGNQIHVIDIDLVDGTPVLDIKPFAPKMSVREGINYGWLEDKVENLNKEKVADERFE